MALHYGVLRGRVDRFKREDDLSSPHLQIRVVDDQGSAWRIAFNVLSGDQSQLILHRGDPLQGHPILGGLGGIASGFTALPPSARSEATALDFLRAPLFDWPTGVSIPSTGPGADDDLQDALVAALTALRTQNGEIFVFGARFPEPGQPSNPRPIDHEFGTSQGIHDVHMNQGSPSPGPFAKDNGVFQDGGLILQYPNRALGLFVRFQTQWLPTDNTTGHRLPTAQPILPGGAVTPPGPLPLVADPLVYIERALVNPVGADPGLEVVVLGNTTTKPIDVSGWSLVDRNGNAERLGTLVLAGGESRAIVLSGKAAQLSNKGGTIGLRNTAGEQVHAVSYSETDAREDRFIRFIT